jgi:hypothetical protein
MVYQQVWDIRYAQTKPTSIHSFEPCLEYFLRSRPVDGHVRSDQPIRAPKFLRPPIFYCLVQ